MTRPLVLAALAAALVAAAPTAVFAADPFPSSAALTSRAVFTCTELTMSNGTVDSAGVSTNVGGNRGDVAANGNIRMSGQSLIKGNATAGPGKSITLTGQASITGTKSNAATTESCTPVDLASVVAAVQAANDNSRIGRTNKGTDPLGGTNHTDFSMSGQETLTLPAGTYYFTKFSLTGGATITLTGTTRILVNGGKVDLTGGTLTNPNAYRLKLWISGPGPFQLQGGAALSAFVYAPAASATIANARLTGSLFANEVTITGPSLVRRAVDDNPPHIAITSPAEGAIVGDPAHVLVKGTASDDEGAVTVQVNGKPAAVAADGTWQVTIDLTGVSPATITAVATDTAGGTAQAKVTVSLIPPPQLTLTSPAPGSIVNTRKVNLTGGAGTAVTVTVNGQSATVANGAWSLADFDLGADGAHTLTIVGTNAGGSSSITPTLTNDTVPPTITAAITPAPNAAGWNNTNVTVSFTCADVGTGVATCPAPVTLTSEGADLAVTRSAVDRAGNSTPITVTVNIDKTAPAIAFLTPAEGAVVADPSLVATGNADDSLTVTVNGVAATIDPATAVFTSAAITLAEGSNTITATGTDRAGNPGSATLHVVLDTRAPQLTIAAPAANACLDVNAVELHGTAVDAHLQGVTVSLGGATANATVDSATGAWNVTIPNVAEGQQVFTVTATDTVGHSRTGSVAVIVDRTAPAIEVLESGAPFSATLVNRALSFIYRATDASPNVAVSATLDGAAYASGASVSAEGSHTLVVTARNCAGKQAQRSFQFTIDRTPPALSNLDPANGVTIGTTPATLTGTSSEAATISIVGRSASATTDASKNFALSGVGFVSGLNQFTLHAVDPAGNASDLAYSVTIRPNGPAIQILDSGQPIVSGSVFTRTVVPIIKVDMPDATVTAQLDSQPFTSGTAVSADGQHTINVTANDSVGHTSNASTTFTIDTHGPAIHITSPANGATVTADQVAVTGTAGDAVSVSVNGITATLAAGGAFTATVPLDPGDNIITASGFDAAGNGGSDTVLVTRGEAHSGVVITYPPDGLPTNRKTTLVTGRVLSPAELQTLTIEGRVGTQTTGVLPLSSDPSGAFRLPDLALFEGTNTITVTATSKNGGSTSAVTHLIADLTPPIVHILAGGQPLEDGARFPTSVVLTVDATDPGSTTAPVSTLQVDGLTVTTPATVSATGGHTAVAVATDAAKNETRVARTFFIGAQGATGCSLGNFDPADGAVVTAGSATLVGTSGGAAGVLINNIAASVANGMFRGTVELPLEGPNSVTISCADASGHATGTPTTITLVRVTSAPSVTIETPAEMASFGTDVITVTGTVSAGVASVDVNGTPATVSGTSWSAANVHLAAGLNVLTAHAKNAAGRVATASRRVLYLKNAPSISISWPNDGYSTGAARIDVSGTYANLDPSTIQLSGAASGGTLETHVASDTSGSYVLRGVTLNVMPQTLTVTGHDALNRNATATVNVTRTAGAPAVLITSPLDNSYLPSTAGPNVAVSGTWSASEGSQIDINGAGGTLAANGTFTGAAILAASGPTPIVVRLTQPDNQVAVATVIVTKLGTAPAVKLAFPAADAVAVDPGVVVLVSFTAPMDETSLRTAFRLLDHNGAPVSGQLRLDKDVLSYAPATTLNPGQRYTISVSTAAQDLAGNALAAAFTSNFTVATTAPTTPPTVTPIAGAVCGSTVTIAGSASAGARIQIDYAGATLFTTADATGAFSQIIAISSASGYAIARVRVVGGDGTLSPAAEVAFQVDCAGPQVLGATYDRTANSIAITFSKPIDMSTIAVGATASIQLKLEDGTVVSGTAAAGATSSSVLVTPGTPDPRALTLVLTVTTAVKDTGGRNLTSLFTQTFTVTGDQQNPNDGSGYITGQIIDATTGRPLAGATVTINAITTITKTNGSYTTRVAEGAYTIHAYAGGYTDVWRQVVVPAGRGVIPIDIRLTALGRSGSVATGDLTLSHGGDTTVTRAATLTIASGAAPSGTAVTLTSVGAQGISGLLPLGWSPLAAAEVRVQASNPAAAQLAFTIPASEVAASGKALTAVEYDSTRDQWRVVQPVVSITGSAATVPFSAGAITEIALVYPDAGTGIAAPAAPVAGGVLTGVADACATATCPPMHVAKPFDLNPKVVLPSGSTVATLTIDATGGAANPFPSGTAIDALINEELSLIDGSLVADVPYSADLVLYRSLAGNTAVADFKLAPSAKAAQVPLQVGVDHIQIYPYPGRLDRGTLIGPAGGRVPSDANVQVEIPTGATAIALHATAKSMTSTELSAFGSIDGFQIVGGMTLTLDPAEGTSTQSVELLKSASATFLVDPSVLGAQPQLILAEILPATQYGRLFRLADRMGAPQTSGSASKAGVTTVAIDRSVLPVDGVVRAGQYLLLLARQPIAFAFGGVRVPNSAYVAGAEVLANTLGVRDLSRVTGVFAIPVVAKPAAPFSLIPVHPTRGEGLAFTAAASPDPGQIVSIGDLLFNIQAPALQSINVTGPTGAINLMATNGAGEISLSTGVAAVFSQAIDASSVSNSSIVVTDAATRAIVPGSVTAAGPGVTWTPASNPLGLPLQPNATYIVTVSGSIKGAHGAPLGASQTVSFSTITQLTNAQMHAERIRITIPDAKGVSTITGDPGALPTAPPEPKAWRAVATRRGKAFITQYQVTANADGGFSLVIGNCGSTVKCIDAVTVNDHIDLEILNAADNIAAILPLTPFVTPDGQGFIAPPDAEINFTAKDGVGVHVPLGAFDQPTMVNVTRLDTDARFAAVPSVHDEMNFYRGVDLRFDCTVGGVDPTASPAPCVAKKNLDLSIPTPSGFDPTGKNLLLGWLGDSVRGPRIMVVDTVRVENGNFTTAEATSGQSLHAQTTAKFGAIPNATTPPPSIDSFTAFPISIVGTQPAKLSWSTTNATFVTIDNGVGSVSLSGDYTVNPSQTTTYTLTASNGTQSVSKSVTVVLTQQPPGGVLTNGDVKRALVKVLRMGVYNVMELRSVAGPVGWVALESIQGNYDLFWSMWNSLFLSHVYLNEPHGRVMMPVILGQGFDVVGYDAGTGLQAFSKVYDPLPLTDPGAVYVVPSPKGDDAGPYPVAAAPYRIEIVDVNAEDRDIESARGFVVKLSGYRIYVTDSTTNPVPGDVDVRVLNVTNGKYSATRGTPVQGTVGDRIIIMVGAKDVDPSTDLTVVFNKAIYTGGDPDEAATNAYLHTVLKMEKAHKPAGGGMPSYEPFDDYVFYRVDSGNLRVKATFPSSLERGAFYRLTIKNTLADQAGTGGGPGLRIGQYSIGGSGGSPSAPLSDDVQLAFNVREVPNELARFDIRWDNNTSKGVVRDLALNGNILLITALEGGLLAYDVADPAALDDKNAPSLPLGYIDPGPNRFWTTASDEHGRIYVTALGNTFGAIQSYRMEDLIGDGSKVNPPRVLQIPKASAIVAWAPGYGSNVDIATDTLLSDRPAGIPRKLSIALQDSDHRYNNLTEFIHDLPGFKGGALLSQDPASPSIWKLTVNLGREAGYQYRDQRITVENLTRDMRWSADAIDDKPAKIENIIAADDDELRIIFNERTYGVVTIFGYGVGIFDLNAVESNDVAGPLPAGAQQWSERIRITSAGAGVACNVVAGDDAIQDLSFSGDSAIIASTSSPDFTVYGLDIRKGVLDMRVEPPTDPTIQQVPCDDRSPVGLVFNPTPGSRMFAFQNAFQSSPKAGGRTPWKRFAQLQTYHWTLEAQDNKALSKPLSPTKPAPGQRGSVAGTRVVRDYLLVPANEYGLIIVDTTKPSGWLGQANIADVIWFPAGVVSVRMIPRTNYCVAVDGDGRVGLVDLGHIDERWGSDGNPISNTALFKSVSLALSKAGAYGVGVPDPRIVWMSEKPIANGSITPVIDPDTGILYSGKLFTDTTLSPPDKQMTVIPVLDPRVQIRADIGKGGMAEIGGIVPLGIDPPDGILNEADKNASLGAFRLQLSLPGGMVEKLKGNSLRLSVESERVPGAAVEQTPAPFPRAHLRMNRVAGSTTAADPRAAAEFTLNREIPPGMETILRHQRGFNKFITPWIVAIADPRAAKDYDWSASAAANGGVTDKKTLGCSHCDRPDRLKNKDEVAGVYELWSGGRDIYVRPELCGPAISGCSSGSSTTTIFDGDKYAYLAQKDRLARRFATVMGDTTRATNVVVAANHPPVADGLMQETAYLHSGELKVRTADLDAGGRNGWNVLFDRTYHSRTMVPGFLGHGWASSIFRSLRPLPNGNVEYRDGEGETWLFKAPTAAGQPYDTPPGLTIHLIRTQDGYQTVDNQRRIATFDSMGRLSTETDEFGTAGVTDKGNTIRYFYDFSGRLKAIVDPVGRATTLTYWDPSPTTVSWKDGRLKQVDDWRHRKIDYDYDANGRLTSVTLPDVEKPISNRPMIQYGYISAPSSHTDFMDLGQEMTSITDPKGGGARVSFAYGSGSKRAKLSLQTWGTGETVQFDFASTTNPSVTDALGQQRDYTLSAAPDDYFKDRAHVTDLNENVPVAAFSGAPIGIGQLPPSVNPAAVSSVPTPRKIHFDHPDGLLKTTTIDGVSTTIIGYHTSPADPPVVDSTLITPIAPAGAGMPPSASAPVSIQRTPSTLDALFTKSISANGLEINRSRPFRGFVTPSVANNQIVSNMTYDASTGQLKTLINPSGGNDSTGAGTQFSIGYTDVTDNDFRRSLPKKVTRGSLTTTVEYPDKDTMISTDLERNVVTTTTFDAVGRPIEVKVSGPDINSLQTLTYDANGWLSDKSRTQNGKTINSHYDYDLMGRLKIVSVDNADVGGTPQKITTTNTYNVTGHTTITSTSTGGVPGATTTRVLDSLGRVQSAETATGGGAPPVQLKFAYDAAGNLVFQADNFVATAWAYDAHGRQIAERHQDGTTTIFDHDAWGRTKEITAKDSAGNIVAHQTRDILPGGMVTSHTVDAGSSGSRTINFGWDGAGRITGASMTGGADTLARHTKFDPSGRVLQSESGAGSLNSVTDAFSQFIASSHSGRLPTAGTSIERAGAGTYTHGFDFNAQGRTIRSQTGSLVWNQHYDEAGNVTRAALPNRPDATFEYDSRGRLTQETMPDSAQNKFQYDLSNSLKTYVDPVNELTSTDNDLLGRPVTRTFSDKTTEVFEWAGPRLISFTDRQKRTQKFNYDSTGRVIDILNGSNAKLDHLDYDSAGRLIAWTNKDAKIEYSGFDAEGRPTSTRQTRYKDSSGFGAATVLDSYAQTHGWNALGQRTSWTMPLPGGTGANGWTSSVQQDFDAAGNVKAIRRSQVGGGSTTLMSADFRNAGRPNTRTVNTSCVGIASCSGATITRSYSYDPQTSQLNEMRVTTGGITIAGAHVGFDGLQVNDIQILGVSSEGRHTRYSYDSRGRLTGSLSNSTDPSATPSAATPGSVGLGLTAADFRNSKTPAPRFDPTTRSILASKGVDVSAVDPTPTTVTEQPGHKLGTVSRNGQTKTIAYDKDGAQISDDGTFVYSWDEKGRLISATQKPTSTATAIRRIVYSYDGRSRMVGRRSETATVNSLSDPLDSLPWQLETRSNVLAADGLPAETTFVWDAMSDNLVAVFNAAPVAGDPNGGLLKQVIHGGLSYDDPIEVTMPNPLAGGSLQRLYPIYDESGTATLQAVVNASGQLVARNLPSDPYGADALDIAAAAVDRVDVHAKKNAAGDLVGVDVTVHSTEILAAATVTNGLRLATVDVNGAVANTATAAPQLVTGDPYSARYSLTPVEWTALVDPAGTSSAGLPAQSLSVAVTSSLRAQAWSAALPLLPAPAWAKATAPVYSSSALPVEVRESLPSLSTWLGTVAVNAEDTRTLYDVKDLALIGSVGGSEDPMGELVAARFQAQPFADPFTLKNYVRARWYDPVTGSWLSPDPAGYRDSSNLYAFGGGDPVNRRDPTGRCWDLRDPKCRQEWADTAKDFAKNTGHDLWNVASLGTLNRVEKQKNLGTWAGVAESTGTGVTRISNAASLGLQDSIYNTQMREGAGVKSVLKGAGNGIVNITPYNEAKELITNKNLTTEQKIRLGFTALSKTAALATLGTGRAAPVELETTTELAAAADSQVATAAVADTEVAAAAGGAGGSRVVNLQPGDFVTDASTTALSTTRGVPVAQMEEVSAVGGSDTLTLVGHGAPGSPMIGGLAPEELASMLQRNGLQAGEIELATCYGACGAQALANATGIPVRAAEGAVNVLAPTYGVPSVILEFEGESMIVGPEVGFRVFTPGGP